jgi:competence protein ComEC
MSRPIIPLLMAFMAGITCSFIFRVPDPIAQLCLLTFLSIILSMLITKKIRYLPFFVILSLFSVGALEMNRYLHPYSGKDHIRNFLDIEKSTVEGIICENPQISPEKTEIIVSAFRILTAGRYLAVSGRILLNIRDAAPLRYGDVIRFRCKLRLPHNFKNPGAFDYERYLRLRGIEVRGFIKDQTDYIVLRREAGNPLRIALERYREHIREVILQKSPGTEGKIILAMLLGDQKEIPKEIMEQFNKTGTTHIIAISGFNIGIVAIFCLYSIRLFMKSSEYLLLRWNIIVLSNIFAILFVILYSFIAGAGISVVRAAIMVAVFMAAIWVARERDHYNTLALAAFLILIASPYSLFDISFQLSFVAVFFLLFLTPRLIALLPPAASVSSALMTSKEQFTLYFKKAMRVITIFFLVSLSAMLGTMPLIILYFNRLSLVGLAANLVVVPILGVVAIPVFLIIILVIPLSATVAGIVISISEFLVRVSLAFVGIFADFSWSSVFISTPTLSEVGAFYLFLISIGFCLDGWISRAENLPLKKVKLLWKIMPLAVIVFFIAHSTYLHLIDLRERRLSVTAVDVGQGSATLVRFPGGKKMLVDGGGSFDDTFDVGKYVLAPFLWHERISKIDIIVLTHPHPDHLQGLLFIMDNFQVHEVWTNGQEIDSLFYRTFRQIIRERGIDLKVISDQTPDMSIAQVGIRILNPPGIHETLRDNQDISGKITPEDKKSILSSIPPMIKNGIRGSDEINDRSIVMKLSFNRCAFLLPGDISQRAEWRIIQSGADLQSDVFFVPHHGSFRSSSTAFLKRINPRVALISCGVDNTFRDPHPDVLRRLEGMKAQCYRTDRDGAIHIETDGVNLKIDVFKKS